MKTVTQRGLGVLLLIATLGLGQRSHAQSDSTLQATTVQFIWSKILGEKRTLFIQTPANMNSYDRYPVLYLLDGEAQIEMVGGQIRYLSESYKIIPQMIVIGIANTDRVRDLTPTHALVGVNGKPDSSENAFGRNSGGGENFLRFIKEELMPHIDSIYNVAPYRILVGHSLGGLMAVHCLAYHPDYFNAYLAISPSLQWDNDLLLSQLTAKLGTAQRNKVLFFSNAGEDSVFRQKQVKLNAILKTLAIENFRFKYLSYPDEAHSAVPVKAFYDGIRLMYPEWYMPFSDEKFRQALNARIVKQHYSALSEDYGYSVLQPHDETLRVARFLRNVPDKIKDAIELLLMNVSNYPHSATTHDTLGDTYAKAGEKAAALQSYEKAIEFGAGEKTREKIKKLSQ